MSKLYRRIAGFRLIVWVAAIAIALFLSCGPLVMNAWAHWKWKQVPCWLKGERYFFTFEGKKYYSGRRDFWQSGSQWDFGTTERDLTPTPPHTPNDTCYINASEPLKSVLRLDAHQRWDRAGRQLVVAGFVLGVAFVLTWVSARKEKMAAQ